MLYLSENLKKSVYRKILRRRTLRSIWALRRRACQNGSVEFNIFKETKLNPNYDNVA